MIHALRLDEGERFKLIKAINGLEAGFVGTYTGKREEYYGESMLMVTSADNSVPYLMSELAEVEVVEQVTA